MARFLAPALALLAASINEVSASALNLNLKLFTKEEIMANMTMD
eukprot:CAMPEP_0203999726 /NCGR_PEP_ID=MMETSP0360-20130528/14804_1 /ASSEMBLY_ACC=CAM_ASM_000342 /TAXON_ID=268821 /ORGANISM="Scrippsiella Hangoei, Strain SHTV-5" /LENGTH=43 /DNA_ID= /DNA_START= /DNA_END= /DNA_ORIENTATION=